MTEATLRIPMSGHPDFGASLFIPPKTLAWVLLPITNSEIIIGKQRKITKTTYIMINAAPPLLPTKYGNLHKLPNPIADPAKATKTPKRLPKPSLFSFAII